jgi:hypothetical protein
VRFLCTPADTNGSVAVLRTTRRLHADGTKRQSAPDGLMGRPAYLRRLTVNFQVTVLKVSSRRLCKPVGPRARRGHPCHRGRSAPPCWRHACPSSKSSEKGVVERRDGGWQITEKGRSVLARMEARSEGASCCAGFADGTARSLGRHGSRPPSSSVAKAPPSL